ELRARWLHHPRVISGATLQHGRSAVPLPRCAEAHGRRWQNWALQSRWCPASSAVTQNGALAEPRQEREIWGRRLRVEIAALPRTETGISLSGYKKTPPMAGLSRQSLQ